jgi:hypothetical protein
MPAGVVSIFIYKQMNILEMKVGWTWTLRSVPGLSRSLESFFSWLMEGREFREQVLSPGSVIAERNGRNADRREFVKVRDRRVENSASARP